MALIPQDISCTAIKDDANKDKHKLLLLEILSLIEDELSSKTSWDWKKKTCVHRQGMRDKKREIDSERVYRKKFRDKESKSVISHRERERYKKLERVKDTRKWREKKHEKLERKAREMRERER